MILALLLVKLLLLKRNFLLKFFNQTFLFNIINHFLLILKNFTILLLDILFNLIDLLKINFICLYLFIIISIYIFTF